MKPVQKVTKTKRPFKLLSSERSLILNNEAIYSF